MVLDPEAWRFLQSEGTDRRSPPERVVAALLDQVARELNAATTMLTAHDRKLAEIEAKLEPITEALVIGRFLRWAFFAIVGALAGLAASWSWLRANVTEIWR